MSFLFGCFTGGLVGVYFGEKGLPFPLSYTGRPEGGIGYLKIDLQVANTIANDVRAAFGYGPIQ